MVVNHRQEMIFPSGGGNRTDEIDVDYPERSGGSGHADDWQPDVVDDLRMLTGLTGVTETGYVAVHTTPDEFLINRKKACTPGLQPPWDHC